jgi:plastocyanin
VSTFTRGAALAAAGLAVLVPAGAAQAASKTVDMGVPPANQKALQNLGADVNAFFPNSVTIHRGDKVKFAAVGFHSLDLPAKGGAPLPIAGPSGATVANDNDAAGAPYWFNGQPDIEFTGALVPPLNFGKAFTYNGKSRVVSKLPLGANLKPVTVKFTKTGTFTYYCNVHAGMKGKVHVVARKAKAPSAKSDAKAVKKQVAAAIKTAKALQNPTVAADTVQVGNAGKGGVEIFAFFPAAKTVPVGTTLTFAMSAKTLDLHTATTGPGDPENDPSSFLGKMANSIGGQPPFDQAGVYPSDPPTGVASLTPTLHGNGFWGTGFMDGSAASPLPSSGKVTIAAAGTYSFYCLIHPFMKAVVTAS